MSTITPKDEMRAALHRLRVAEGYAAVESLLAKIGVANINSVSEDAYEQVMAACPKLPRGQGILAASGDKKPSTRDALNKMALDRNSANLTPGEDVADAMKTVLKGEDGFNNAGKAMNARGGPKQAKAK